MSPNQDSSSPRLAPRPIARPPVDQQASRAFGRPNGVDGSFVAEELRPAKFRGEVEFQPKDKPADPVLEEAFGRPYPGGDSLQRHPADAGAIQADIVENLVHRELTIAWLARRHGLSERYIQMLFEAEHTTFSQFLLEQRLDRVHKALGDARFLARSISALAYEFGFGDLSYFNRTFRRRYGVTPSDRRAAAMTPD